MLLEVNLSLTLTAREVSGRWFADLRVEVISLAIAGLFFGVTMYIASAATIVVVLCLLTLAAEADWG
jgi:ABC-type transport system involved in cytochrome c biogenesis permease component